MSINKKSIRFISYLWRIYLNKSQKRISCKFYKFTTLREAYITAWENKGNNSKIKIGSIKIKKFDYMRKIGRYFDNR